MIKRLLQSDLVANRYYAFGLAVQKGTPFLVVPLVVWAFGAQAYANYVLTFAATQLVAMAMSLGTTNSLVVFWYQHEDKSRYLRSLILLISGLTLLIGFCVFALLTATSILPTGVIPRPLWAVTIVLFGAIYNWNAVGLSLVRVTERSRRYFLTVLVTTGILLLLVVGVSRMMQGTLPLIMIYMAVMALQSALFFAAVPLRVTGRELLPGYRQFTRRIFGYSVPVVAYTLVSLSVFTVDKWVIRSFYPDAEFTQYVLNFQFAFATNIVAVVIGMYLLPMLCRLVESEDRKEMAHKVHSHYLLSLVGTFVVGVGMYVYGRVTGVGLTGDYWILVMAFGFSNLFTVNVNVLEAFRNSRTLARIALIPTALFWLGFVLAAASEALVWNYWLFGAYYAGLFASSLSRVVGQGVPIGLADRAT